MATFGGVEVPAQYQSIVLAAAQRWNVPPSLLAAQLKQESDFNPHSVSSAGAVGIAQFLPSTAKEWGVDPWDVNSAIDGMAKLDAHYKAQFGSWQLALAAYNAGPNAVSKAGNKVPAGEQVQHYVAKILQMAGDLGSYSPAPGVAPVSLTTSWENIQTFLGKVQDATFWRRVGVGAMGVAVVGVAAYFAMAKEPGTMKPLRRIEGVVK